MTRLNSVSSLFEPRLTEVSGLESGSVTIGGFGLAARTGVRVAVGSDRDDVTHLGSPLVGWVCVLPFSP